MISVVEVFVISVVGVFVISVVEVFVISVVEVFVDYNHVYVLYVCMFIPFYVFYPLPPFIIRGV